MKIPEGKNILLWPTSNKMYTHHTHTHHRTVNTNMKEPEHLSVLSALWVYKYKNHRMFDRLARRLDFNLVFF